MRRYGENRAWPFNADAIVPYVPLVWVAAVLAYAVTELLR
jgi:hypothetical protein